MLSRSVVPVVGSDHSDGSTSCSKIGVRIAISAAGLASANAVSPITWRILQTGDDRQDDGGALAPRQAVQRGQLAATAAPDLRGR